MVGGIDSEVFEKFELLIFKYVLEVFFVVCYYFEKKK